MSRTFRQVMHELLPLFGRLLCLLAPLFQNLIPFLSAASLFFLYHLVSSNHTITVFSLTRNTKDAFHVCADLLSEFLFLGWPYTTTPRLELSMVCVLVILIPRGADLFSLNMSRTALLA
jgi:hypothetical protein